ncbi:MAG: phage major capsid protein, partial [Actinomycetota bacterium]
MNPRLTALRTEHDNLRSAIEAIDAAAADEARDLTDSERTESDQLFERMEALNPEITRLADRQRSMDETAGILARLGIPAAQPNADHVRSEDPAPTAGEWLVNYNRAQIGDTDAQEFLRAAAQQGLADNPGVVPESVAADIIKFVDSERYLVNSMTTRPMMRGDQKQIRLVTQPGVDEQTVEFEELTSSKLSIVKDPVARQTFGGYVEVSEQDEEFSDPVLMDELIMGLADQYAIQTDTAAGAGLVAAATNTADLPPATTDPDT